MKHFPLSNQWLFLLAMAAMVFTPFSLNATNAYVIEASEEAVSGIDLELEFAADPIEYSIFTNNLFRLTLTNKGEENATGIAVYAPFPSSLSYTNSTVSQGDYSVWTNIWQVGDLASGESAVLDLSLFVLNVDTDISLFAQVQAANETDVDSTPNNNTTQIPTEDDEAVVTVTRLGGGGGNNGGNEDIDIELGISTNHAEVNAGLEFSYIITATNSGEDKATGVRVHFPLPSQVKYVSNNNDQTTYDPITGEWNIGNIPSKATRSLLVDVEVLVGGIISATAEVVATNETDTDSTPNNGVGEEDDMVSIDMLGLQIDLELNMELPEETSNVVTQGSEVTFLVHVDNKGPTVGYNTKIRAILPGGFTYVRNVLSMGEYLDDLGVWVIGDIPPYETQTMQITATMDVEGPLTYTCEARTSNVPDVDSTPSNYDPDEDDIDSITIYTNSSSLLSDIELSASVEEKISSSENAHSLILTITNNGPASTTDIVVMDDFPSELHLVEAISTNGTYEEGTWTIEGLENGETAVLNLDVTVELSVDSTTYYAQVIAMSSPDVDSTPDNNPTHIPHEDDEVSVAITPKISTNIEGALEIIDLQLYPIPTYDLLNIRYSATSTSIDLNLYGLSGKLLYYQRVKTVLGENTIQLDLASFPVGNYFLLLQTAEGNARVKVLKE